MQRLRQKSLTVIITGKNSTNFYISLHIQRQPYTIYLFIYQKKARSGGGGGGGAKSFE